MPAGAWLFETEAKVACRGNNCIWGGMCNVHTQTCSERDRYRSQVLLSLTAHYKLSVCFAKCNSNSLYWKEVWYTSIRSSGCFRPNGQLESKNRRRKTSQVPVVVQVGGDGLFVTTLEESVRY